MHHLWGTQANNKSEPLLQKRTEDKLLEKTSWYKVDNKRKVENQESKFQYNPPSKKRKLGKKVNTIKNKDKKIKSVMFVLYTKHSELATRLWLACFWGGDGWSFITFRSFHPFGIFIMAGMFYCLFR